MRVCAVVKYPPVQGGVSARSFWIARALASQGHDVTVVSNAAEVEQDFRIWMGEDDLNWLDEQVAGAGAVRLVYTNVDQLALAHIPYANPFTTKLASIATEEIRGASSDVIFSYYFEPYGLAGHLASTWTGRPLVLQHAGSDRTRLMAHSELGVAYKEMMRAAAAIISASKGLTGVGLPDQRIWPGPPPFVPDVFNPDAAPLDVNAILAEVGGAAHPWVTNTDRFVPERPTIGIYGKAGRAKGSFDLLSALSRLDREGLDFNLLAMVGGEHRRRFCEAVEESGLAERTWTLPFLAHWRVPSFIRACTAVCFLERRFPVAVHAPGIPLEITACGTCLVLSGEIARKRPWRDTLKHGTNCFIVDDPEDTEELTSCLAAVIKDPDGAETVGRAGAQLVPSISLEELGTIYTGLFEHALRSQSGSTAQSRTSAVPAPAPLELEDTRAYVAHRMPGTSLLAGDQIVTSLRRFLDRLPSAEALPSLAHVVHAFACFLIDEADGATADSLAADVLRFERDQLWLTVDLDSEAGLPVLPRPPVSVALWPSDAVKREHRLVRSNWLRVRDFGYDIEAFLRSLSTGAEGHWDDVEPRETTFLFLKRSNLFGSTYRVGKATKSILALCDGSHTMDDIEKAVGGTDASRRHQVGMQLQFLLRESVIARRMAR